MKNSQNFRISGSSGIRIEGLHQAINGSAGEPEPEEVRPVKVLFLAANPAETSRLSLDQEVKAIELALRSATSDVRFELEQGWAVDERDLQDGLLRHEPDIVHLSGHGDPSGRLILEEGGQRRDTSGLRATLTPEEDPKVRALARLFATARGRIRCVVLNACFSEVAARAIAESVDCVIGMSDAVDDSCAIRFSWAFYHALAQGQSVQAAFDLGLAQITFRGLRQESVPRLVAPKSDPTALVFTPAPR